MGEKVSHDQPLTKKMLSQVRQYDVLPTLGNVLRAFPPSEYELFTAVCRLFSHLAQQDEKNCKIIGQSFGVEGSILLLKYGRGIVVSASEKNPPRVSEFEDRRKINVLSNLSRSEMAQQALWTLDILSTIETNVPRMKREKLKFILKEIELNHETKEVGTKLIIPRRLRCIQWDQVPRLTEDS